MALSAADKLLLERVDWDFDYHAPEGLRVQYHQQLRAQAKAFARTIVELCPEGRERAVALTSLKECLRWANASVAHGRD
jgi:hypothetical protein